MEDHVQGTQASGKEELAKTGWVPGDTTPLLNTALAVAQGHFGTIPRTKAGRVGSNENGRTYKYSDISDMLKAVIPHLSKEGLSLRQPLRMRGGRQYLVTELHHRSGEWISDDGIEIPTGMQPQAFGSQLTYQRRYGASSLLALATEEDDDGAAAERDHQSRETLPRDRPGRRRQSQAGSGDAGEPAQGGTPAAEPVLATEEQRKAWNQARKLAGWTVPQATHFAKRWGGLQRMPAEAVEEAMAWATRGPQSEAERAEAEEYRARDEAGKQPVAAAKAQPAATEPTATAALPKASTAGPERTLNNAEQRTFLSAAEKHAKSGADIDRWLKSQGLTSVAQLLPSRLQEALTWAERPEGPAPSSDEVAARAGIALLGLNLVEIGRLVDTCKGDWAEVRARVNTEIDRREAAEA